MTFIKMDQASTEVIDRRGSGYFNSEWTPMTAMTDARVGQTADRDERGGIIDAVRRFPGEVTDSGWFKILDEVVSAPALSGLVSADWVIVGGGWFGVNAARRIAELRPDDRVILVDASEIGNNAGGRCAGYAIDLAHNPRNPNFAEDQQGNIEDRDLNLEGIAYLREGVERHSIKCDWSEEGKIHAAATPRGEACLRTFARALGRIGERYEWYDAGQMREVAGTPYYTQGLFTPGTVLLQPASALRGIAANLGANVAVYENTAVTKFHFGAGSHILKTPNGEIRTKNVILANNGFISEFGFHAKTAIPIYTYGSLTRPLTEEESDRIGGRSTFGLIPADSFGSTVRRTVDNRLFIRNVYDYAGGFRTTEAQIERARKSHQKSFDRRFPSISSMGFEYSWGGALSLSQNGGVVFGQLAEGVYGAGYCNGTGVSKGAAFGKAIAELACGMDSRSIRILQSRAKPSKAYPKLITSLGVKASTIYRLWLAGKEV